MHLDSADLLLNRALFVLQAHRDMEERLEEVVNEYAQLARVTERLRSNVHAQYICRAYYISYAYTRVSIARPSEQIEVRKSSMKLTEGHIPGFCKYS